MKANNLLHQLKLVQKCRAEFPRQMKLRIMVPGCQDKYKFKNTVCQRGQELRAEMNYQVILGFIIYILKAFRGPDWTWKSSKASCISVCVLQSRIQPKIQADIPPSARAWGIATGLIKPQNSDVRNGKSSPFAMVFRMLMASTSKVY